VAAAPIASKWQATILQHCPLDGTWLSSVKWLKKATGDKPAGAVIVAEIHDGVKSGGRLASGWRDSGVKSRRSVSCRHLKWQTYQHNHAGDRRNDG